MELPYIPEQKLKLETKFPGLLKKQVTAPGLFQSSWAHLPNI